MSLSKIGYCRVSTTDQNMTAQLELLHKAGCDEIFKEKLSGSNIDRPELKKLLAYIRKGDTVTVTKLDRLARSTKDLLGIAEEIKKKGADFEVLNINLDTKSYAISERLVLLGISFCRICVANGNLCKDRTGRSRFGSGNIDSNLHHSICTRRLCLF
jgi:DNA invertase Pin-like site-specific DNA recombinase